MTYNVCPKGSQWRKWDLHVHTPASFHWNGGKLLRDMDEAEKEASFQQLLATLKKSDVAVFCFTDYWTLDGYIQFVNYLKREKLSCSKTIFPGMELRVEAPVDYRLNIQVILSDLLTEQQLEDFKSRLTVRSIKRRISDESIMAFARTLDASKAKIHGFGDPSHLSDNDLLRLGVMTIEVTKSSLEAAIQSVPPATVYIVLPFDTSDGLEKLDWETQPQANNYFMQTAHACESRKEETTNLFLGIETDMNRHFIENFQKTLNYVQKPVICGSDAHRFSDYGKYPSNRITWIKADPTFQGFRQIFFEPRERVRIQELPPEEKTPYLVIDKVRFIDNTGSKFFPADWIQLNENLNTVIGGKSSGKSLLLYHIAKAVAPDLVRKRSQEITILVYRFGDPGELDFEVRWKDGHTDTLSSASEHTNREIEYIPQMYVNSLAEKEGRTSLYQLIESILEQNASYRDFIQQLRNEISQLETDIERDLSNLLRLRSEIQRLYSERKEIGTLSAIKREIQRLSSKIDVLREESDFTSEEKRRYESLQRSMHIQLERRRKYESLHRAIMDLIAAINRLQNYVAGTLDASSAELGLDRFSKRIITALSSSATSRITNTFSAIALSQSSLADRARAKATKCGNHAQRIRELLKPYEDKVRDQELLKRLSSDLERQRETLAHYEEKDSQIDTVREAGLRTRESLLRNYSDLFQRYKRIVSMLQLDEYSKIDEEIVLETSLKFDTDRFLESFSDLFDRRFKLGAIFGPCFDEYNDFCFEEDSHIETMTSIYDALSSKRDSIRYKQGATVNDAITQLFKNYFLIEYNIRYKDDDILDMSPGKRGLVLLQLLLHISNATHPILIDQPEDNLDNRTISNELRRFVNAKKLARQIIMVTHDANLVVLTDAENVIVSNQAGQQADQENAEFRFEYVTGALEHSFRQPEDQAPGVLFSCGIREHVCDVLEGGEEAFRKREQRYGFSNR